MLQAFVQTVHLFPDVFYMRFDLDVAYVFHTYVANNMF
jgi:hypothetical protein